MRRLFYILMFAVVFLFFWNTGIQNRTEAEDAYEYAHQVEVNGHDWLYHPHHLLFGVVARQGYRFSQALGSTGRAHGFLVLLSSLSAAGSVFLFFRFCYRRYSMRPVSSLFAAGFLALSYGFWRYSCEAEVIAPAGFLVLLSVYLATSPNPRLGQVINASIFSAISVLIHILNGVPVFLAIPLFYLLKKKARYAALHTALTAALVLVTYLLIFYLETDHVLTKVLPSVRERMDWSFLFKSIIGLGQCIVTGNFLFGFEAFSQKMIELFPSRMLAEEVYMGKHMSPLQRFVPVVTTVLFVLSVGYGLCQAIYSWQHAFKTKRTHAMNIVGGWQTIAVVGLWFLVYAAAILLLEPGNPEVWVLGMIPFWLLVCGLIIAPIARANQLWIVLLMLGVLGLHNYAGGINVLQNPETDYNLKKASWVLEHVSENDLIVTAENPVFVRYLTYHSKAEVIDLNILSEGELDELFITAERVFVLDDVFAYPPSMRVRFPSMASRVSRFASELRPCVTKTADNEFGGVWELNKKPH